MAAIAGRAHLFTENTLYPLTLVLDDRRYLKATARLWLVVLCANLAGALALATLAVEIGAFSHDLVAHLADLGRRMSA